MKFISTRNKNTKLSAAEAIIKGISNDGGLFVPSHFPDLTSKLKDFSSKTYAEVAYDVLKEYLTDFTDDEIGKCVKSAYDNKFESENIVEIKKADGTYFLELYHGPTLAFKDMALTIMPHLLKTSIEKIGLNKEVVILAATSGDTGKAALEGFKDVENTKIIVFFPENGVSAIQKLQMKTQTGKNTHVIGIEGNFDDAQTGVKNIFSNKEFSKHLSENNFVLSSANSINIGRLLPQIVYYFYTYSNLLKNNEINTSEKINFVIPTGNFGNILAGFYAKKMGLPINKLICASNENNVLYDFFRTGEYNKNRELKLTTSPSMDILISSNLERLLFEILDRDEKTLTDLMNDLNSNGVYNINKYKVGDLDNPSKNILESFYSEYSTEEDVKNEIKRTFENSRYLIDTHTAVALNCYEKYKKETDDTTKTVIVSTASPYKFSQEVLDALDYGVLNLDSFEIIDYLNKVSNVDIPNSIEKLRSAEILHKTICKKDEFEIEIKKFLKVR